MGLRSPLTGTAQRGSCLCQSSLARFSAGDSAAASRLLLNASGSGKCLCWWPLSESPICASVDAKVESGRLFPPCSIFLTTLSPQRSCCFFQEAVSGLPSYTGLIVLSSELWLSDVGLSPLPCGVCGPIRPQTTEAQARPRFLCVDQALLHVLSADQTLMSAGWVEMRQLSLGLPQ